MARPITPLNSADKTAMDRMYAGPLGTELSHKRHVVCGRYDFATLGGTVGDLALKDSDGNTIVIPSGAIITQVYINIVTACVSTSNDGTIALKANAANDLLSAVDADTLSGITSGVPTGSAATMVKTTADRNITLSIAVHALTAGKFDVYVEFVYNP